MFSKKEFEKYFYYANAVQSPEIDISFLNQVFLEIYNSKPLSLKEDFCGTFLLCCEWIKQSSEHKALGVDLNSEPLNYGKEKHLSQLSPLQKKQITIHRNDVLNKIDFHLFDIVLAQNFSYFIFKKRQTLLEYFKNAKKHLNKDGLFIIDAFGGSESTYPNIDETEHRDFIYQWDQDSFNPITHEAQFYIHFKRKNEETRHKVFAYDWRIWSLPELKDILIDAGFKEVFVYWEQEDKEDGTPGEYKATTEAENCEAWVAYLVGKP